MSLILSGTDGVSDVDGTAATPALRGTDTNTGIFFPAADTIAFAEGGAEVARFDSAGNFGLGVTPSAWSSYRALQIAGGGSLVSFGNAAEVWSNAFFNGSSNLYIANGFATRYHANNNGAHAWYTAPSGTAGNTISFTQAMTLDASGNLGVGTTSPSQRLHVVGQASFGGAGTYQSVFVNNNSTTGGGGFVPQQNGVSCGTFTVSGAWLGDTSSDLAIGAYSPNIRFYTNNSTSERARIDSSGNLLVGTTSSDGRLAVRRANNGASIASFGVTGTAFAAFYAGSAGAGAGGNGAETALYINATNGTGRSINAGGTVNASGADYAEYMAKAGDFTVAKGDVVGINADGKLTNVFANAVSFCVKSTDPSYVGGDIWGNEDALGKRPADDATDEEKAAYADALEAARQKVDRIAFAGQVPVNVVGATPGQYIVPVNDNGAIKGIAKNEADMTLAEYMKAVGKVIAVKEDGRAFIIVKVA